MERQGICIEASLYPVQDIGILKYWKQLNMDHTCSSVCLWEKGKEFLFNHLFNQKSTSREAKVYMKYQ